MHARKCVVFFASFLFFLIASGFKIQEVQLRAAASLTVNETLLTKSGEWISVTWAGIPYPSSSDMIALFSPSSVNLTTHVPVKYKYVDVDSGFASGKGTTSFRLVNMRTDGVFVYIQNNNIIALSQMIDFQNHNEPLQAHLSLTNDPSAMVLIWVTKNTNSAGVKWGFSPNNYTFSSWSVSSSSYTTKEMCGAPANSTGWMDPGMVHRATLSGLVPNQKYYYIYGDSAFGWSEERWFYSPPPPYAESINVLAFGDMGKGEVDGSSCFWDEAPSIQTTTNIQYELSQYNYQAVFHIGDISYAVGHASQWDSFFDQIEPLATRVPWMVCPGNHEVDHFNTFLPGGDSYGECGIPYFARFQMPNGNLPWYSFESGPAHFVLMSTEHDFTLNSPQYKFIANDLANVDRKRTPWVIFSGHRPMYVSSTSISPISGDQTVAALLREHVEPLLYKFKVDMAWWGHHHSYQRSCPVYNLTCVSDGTVHVVIGMAGMGLSQNIEPIDPDWFVMIDDEEYGYTKLSITKSSLRMQYLNENRVLKDDFTLLRK